MKPRYSRLSSAEEHVRNGSVKPCEKNEIAGVDCEAKAKSTKKFAPKPQRKQVKLRR